MFYIPHTSQIKASEDCEVNLRENYRETSPCQGLDENAFEVMSHVFSH